MLLDEIATYVGGLTAFTPGVDLFAVEMPPSPDVCVSLHEYQGRGPVDTFGQVSAYEDSRLHIRVRATNYPDAMASAALVNNVLYAVCEQSIGGHVYHRIGQNTVWTVAEVDSSNRVVVACDYVVVRTP